MSRKRVPLNQNECTADFRIGVPFEQNLQEEYLHEIYPLYSPGEEDDEYEDEDGEKCSIMRNNV